VWHLTGVFFLIVMLTPTSGFRAEENPPDTSALSLLEAMVAEDQSLRSIDTLDYGLVYAADVRHREAVFTMLSNNEIVTAKAKYLAALLLQHADPTTCAECYLLAYKLSVSASEMGYDKARRLAALNLDRYLVFTGKPQKYGTQYNCDSTSHWYLFPVDSTVTDEERRNLGLQPLDSLNAEIDRLNSALPKK